MADDGVAAAAWRAWQGKTPVTLRQEPSDLIVARSDSNFGNAADERALAAIQLELEGSLSRAALALALSPSNVSAAPMLTVANKAGCARIPVFGASTSCRIIDRWDAAETDELTGKDFLSLLPSSVRPPGVGSKDRMQYDHTRPGAYLRYDADAWPSFCGQSATFSLWLETNTVHGGCLLSRYSAAQDDGHSTLQWALYAEGYGLCVKGERAPSSSYLPARYGLPLEKMRCRASSSLARAGTRHGCAPCGCRPARPSMHTGGACCVRRGAGKGGSSPPCPHARRV
jgi:hypothetical protein